MPANTDVDNQTVLCCGMVCIDLVTLIAKYPEEDSDQRSLGQEMSRGGNASNTCKVLKELGQHSAFFGTMVENTPETKFMLESFQQDGIALEKGPMYPSSDHLPPNSVVLLNSLTGQRTIVHTNLSLPELTLEDFQNNIDLRRFNWVHMEGRPRNHDNVVKILEYLNAARQENGYKYTISVEIELPGTKSEDLLPLADVVFISKEVGESHKCKDKVESVRHFLPRLKATGQLVVAWGDQGAAAAINQSHTKQMANGTNGSMENGDNYVKGSNGVATEDIAVIDVPAFTSEQRVVDRHGARDTFIAGVIAGLNKKRSLRESVEYGCYVAGTKVGQRGLNNLKDKVKNIETFGKLQG